MESALAEHSSIFVSPAFKAPHNVKLRVNVFCSLAGTGRDSVNTGQRSHFACSEGRVHSYQRVYFRPPFRGTVALIFRQLLRNVPASKEALLRLASDARELTWQAKLLETWRYRVPLML